MMFLVHWILNYVLKRPSTRIYLYSWFRWFRIPKLFDYYYLRSRWLQSLLCYQFNRFERTLQSPQYMMELGARKQVNVKPHLVALRSSGYLEIHELQLPESHAPSITPFPHFHFQRPIVLLVCGPGTDGEIFLHDDCDIIPMMLRHGFAVWIINARGSKYFSSHPPSPPPFYTSSSASQHVAKVSFGETGRVTSDFHTHHVQDLHHVLSFIQMHYQGSEEAHHVAYVASSFVLMGYLTGADLNRLFLLSHQSDEFQHRIAGTVQLSPLYSPTTTSLSSSSSPILHLSLHPHHLHRGVRGWLEYCLLYLNYLRGGFDLLHICKDIFQPYYYSGIVRFYYSFFLGFDERRSKEVSNEVRRRKRLSDSCFDLLFPHKQFLYSLLYPRSYERLLRKYWTGRYESDRLTFPPTHSDVICYVKVGCNDESSFTPRIVSDVSDRNSIYALSDRVVQGKIEDFLLSLQS